MTRCLDLRFASLFVCVVKVLSHRPVTLLLLLLLLIFINIIIMAFNRQTRPVTSTALAFAWNCTLWMFQQLFFGNIPFFDSYIISGLRETQARLFVGGFRQFFQLPNISLTYRCIMLICRNTSRWSLLPFSSSSSFIRRNGLICTLSRKLITSANSPNRCTLR